MTADFDLRDAVTPTGCGPEPTGRLRWRRWWLPIGLTAAAVTTIGGVALSLDDTSVGRVPPTSATVARSATHPTLASTILQAERRWAVGDEFEIVPTDDLCLVQDPC
jgi:hypothetical protein